MLKLKLQYFDHLMQGADSQEKTLMLGRTEGRKRSGWQRVRWLDGIRLNGHEFEQTPRDSGGQGSLVGYSPWGLRVTHLVTEQQQIRTGPPEMGCRQSLGVGGGVGGPSELLPHHELLAGRAGRE